MLKADRSRAARLESILARHAAWEKRTLADLHDAGFKFRTIDAAFQRLKTQRALAGFSQAQIDVAVAVLARKAGS
jgi:hypothetical protein